MCANRAEMDEKTSPAAEIMNIITETVSNWYDYGPESELRKIMRLLFYKRNDTLKPSIGNNQLVRQSNAVYLDLAEMLVRKGLDFSNIDESIHKDVRRLARMVERAIKTEIMPVEFLALVLMCFVYLRSDAVALLSAMPVISTLVGQILPQFGIVIADIVKENPYSYLDLPKSPTFRVSHHNIFYMPCVEISIYDMIVWTQTLMKLDIVLDSKKTSSLDFTVGCENKPDLFKYMRSSKIEVDNALVNWQWEVTACEKNFEAGLELWLHVQGSGLLEKLKNLGYDRVRMEPKGYKNHYYFEKGTVECTLTISATHAEVFRNIKNNIIPAMDKEIYDSLTPLEKLLSTYYDENIANPANRNWQAILTSSRKYNTPKSKLTLHGFLTTKEFPDKGIHDLVKNFIEKTNHRVLLDIFLDNANFNSDFDFCFQDPETLSLCWRAVEEWLNFPGSIRIMIKKLPVLKQILLQSYGVIEKWPESIIQHSANPNFKILFQ
jgi:hypothetical protein